MKEIIKRIVDNSEVDEYKEGVGKTIITAYARIDGWAVGIVANQRKVVKTKREKCNLEVLFTLILQIKLPNLLPTVIRKNSFIISPRCYWFYGRF